MIRDQQVPPEGCLAPTFTRRAAAELGERLATLLGAVATRITVTTFHGLGRAILRAQVRDLGLDPAVAVAPEGERVAWLAATLRVSERRAARWLAAISLHKRCGTRPAADGELAQADRAYETLLAAHGVVDLDDLVARPVALFEGGGRTSPRRGRRATRGSRSTRIRTSIPSSTASCAPSPRGRRS